MYNSKCSHTVTECTEWNGSIKTDLLIAICGIFHESLNTGKAIKILDGGGLKVM